MQKAKVRTKRAFTLVELLVVVSIIALLISILLPSLKKAREQTKAVVCLANQKGMSTAVLTYTSEYGGVLVGPLHPAIYRFQTREKYEEYGIGDFENNRNRQLTWVLRGVLGQKGGGERGENVADALATCPAMAGYASENHFKAYMAAGNNRVFPTHYTLNDWGAKTADAQQTGMKDNVRQTNPSYYFGWSPPTGNTDDAIPPQSLSRIKRTSDEWMIATAWYRSAAANPVVEFQQEGPYQSGWSGNALPYFAPHFKTGLKTMYTNNAERTTAAQTVSKQKSDGKTNTVYMDGHAAMVSSKTFSYNGFKLCYGFPGTVNPRLSESSKAVWAGGKWK